jgi:hypothetical protein
LGKWQCAIIRNTSQQPIALVVLVARSAFSNGRQGDAVRALFRRTKPFRGLSVVLANQAGKTLHLKGDSSLVSQLSRQNWLGWDWRDITIN